ncbi:hypothetical protein [Actinokineospora sp. HUAS TT18]|uniref:hypothetical protein n=1 Tax=Actinokineospora sp. HUAS TT18 TaxID=3447451 RepID=UPI003F51C2E0
MLNTPYTRWSGDGLHGRHPQLTPAWIRLDTLFAPHPTDPDTVVPEGLSTSGTVRAFVTGWFRIADTGAWLAVVNYAIGHADDRKPRVMVIDQLVPGHAVTRRDDNRPL